MWHEGERTLVAWCRRMSDGRCIALHRPVLVWQMTGVGSMRVAN